MNLMRPLKAFLIAEAVSGGYLVHQPGAMDRSNMFPVIDFAGSLPECLDYIRKQYEAQNTGAAQ